MQEQTLYQIFDELSDMVIIIERKARVVHYTNRAAQHIAGIRTGDVLCPDCLPLLNESADAVFANHLDRLTLPDGTEIPVAVTRRPAEHESPPALIYLVRDLRTADGSILPDVLLADDLVDALKTRDALARGRHLNKILLGALPQSVFLVNRAGTVQNFQAMDALDLGQLPGDHNGEAPLADILLPEMASLSCDLVERAFATGLVKSNTLDLLLVDTPVSYAFYAVPADDDLIVLIVRDVTRERRSLVALRASEQRYRGLIESQQDLIVRVDGEGRFTFVNDAYCQKFGKTHQELIGATFMPLVHEDDLPATLKAMEMLEVPPYRAYVEQRALTAKGWRWLAWEDYAIRDEAGQTIEIQAVGRDITDLKESQRTLAYQSHLFESISTATRRLLAPGDFQAALDDVLRIVGEVIQADFIYLYENRTDDETGEPVAVVRSYWRNASMQDATDYAVPDVLPWTLDGQPIAFYERLRSGEGLQRVVTEFGDIERGLIEELGLKSGLAEPIMIDQEFWGLFAVYAHFEVRVWTDTEMQALRTLAANLATGVARVRVEDDLRRARSYAETLRMAGMAFTATLEPEVVLQTVLQQAHHVVPFEAASVMMIEDGFAHVTQAIGYEHFGVAIDDMRSRSIDLAQSKLLRKIIETKHSIVIETVTHESKWPYKPGMPTVGSWMAAPIKIGGHVVGVFVVESTEPGRYNDQARQLIEPFVSHAAMALQNAQLYNQVVQQTLELTRAVARMKSVSEAAHAILSTLDLSESLDRLLSSIATVISFDTANVMLLKGSQLHFMAHRGYDARGINASDLTAIEPMLSHMPGLRQIIDIGKARVVPNVAEDDLWVTTPNTQWIRSWMGAPIKVRDSVVGLFSLDSSQVGFYTREDVEMIEIFAGLASVAYQNAQLHHEVETQLGQIIALYSASQSILSSLDLNTILNQLAEQITSLTGATSTMICDYDPDEQSGVIQAAFASAQGPVLETMRRRGDRIRLRSKQVQHIILGTGGVQLTGTRLKEAFPDSDLMENVQLAILIPLASRGRTTGFALVRDSHPAEQREQDLRLMIDALANQAANALQQAYYVDEIERLESLKSNMLRIASHDLRKPLQRISSSVEMLSETLPASDVAQNQNYFDFALSGVKEMDETINELLSYRRVEERYHQPEIIRWCEVIERAIGAVRIEYETKQQQLDVECPQDLQGGRGDMVQLARALANLVGNAVKYTPEYGHITVRAYTAEVEGSSRVCVEVEDTGIGIPEEHQAAIFEPFYRAPQTDPAFSPDKVAGIGLGLAVVKSAVTYHNGEVYFKSAPGQGSLFGFWIPV